MNVPAVPDPPAQPAHVPVNLNDPLEDLDQAFRVAKLLSQSSMVPAALRGSPQNCLVTMLLGKELGLSWIQALRGVYVLPSGQPGLRGALLLARMRAAGHRYEFVETSDSCEFIVRRKDEEFKIPYTGKFTVEDAKMAGLVRQDKDGKLIARSNSGQPLPWEMYRRDMLRWRAVARGTQIGCPELIFGFDLAGIGDSGEGGVPVGGPSGPAPAPEQVHTGVIVDEDAERARLAQLDAQLRQTPVAEDAPYAGHGRALADYDARPDRPVDDGTEPAEADPRAAGAAPARGAQPPPPPDYADLDQLLRRCGFHQDKQPPLVSLLVHRDVDTLTDLTRGEVIIAHGAIAGAVRNLAPVGARRAALEQLAQAERDAWAAAEGEPAVEDAEE